MEPFLPVLWGWSQKFHKLPLTTVDVFSVTRETVTPVTDGKFTVTDSSTAAVLKAAADWIEENNPAQRVVVQCVSGSPTRILGKRDEKATAASMRSICPRGPTYLTMSGIGYIASAIGVRNGWPASGCLSIGNHLPRVEAAGDLWYERLEKLQSTPNAMLGAQALTLRYPEAMAVYPTLADYYLPGETAPDVEVRWKEFEDLLRGHDWSYGMSDDYSVFIAGDRKRSSINILMSQLKFLDAARAQALWDKYTIKKEV